MRDLINRRTKIRKWIFVTSVAAMLLICLILFQGYAVDKMMGVIGGPSAVVISRLSIVSSFISQISKIRTLAAENISFRDENMRLLSQIVSQVKLEEENLYLRQLLELPLPVDRKRIEAGVFNIQLTPKGHIILLNVGVNSGVSEDDIVISQSGVVIGIVKEVFNNYSRVMIVTDPDLKITVELSSGVSAMARGAYDDGILLDFISQSDEIANGDLVKTEGNDLFPRGLLVGKVKSVTTDNSSLFKQVRVKPAIDDIRLSRVIVLGQR